MIIVTAAITSFLLAFPALFSIVNPVGGALIYNNATAGRTHAERTALAGRVAFFSALVMLVALWGGAYVLNFFGITLGALRIAGGLVVAVRAWELLAEPERQEAKKQEQAAPANDLADAAFFPLTMPFTTGPGTISVAVALGANRPPDAPDLVGFFIGMSAAAVAMALTIWLAYRSADQVLALVGSTRRAGAQPSFRIPAALHRDADPAERGERGPGAPIAALKGRPDAGLLRTDMSQSIPDGRCAVPSDLPPGWLKVRSNARGILLLCLHDDGSHGRHRLCHPQRFDGLVLL